MLSFIGLIIYEGLTITSLKMALVFTIVFLANPIGSHILGKAAYKSGHRVVTAKDLVEEVEKEEDDANIHH
jgi:multicomponent Na+:H+ antiporter subunit G